MSRAARVVGVVGSCLAAAGCGSMMPSLDFKGAFSTAPTSGMLEAKSEPPGAEVKTSAGQSCRTPCELSVQVAPEISATFALDGYQPQTISVRSDGKTGFGSPRLAPNPVYVELRAAPPASPVKKHVKKKPPAVATRVNSPVASAAPPAPPAASAPTPASSPAPETAPSATNYPWPDPPSAK